MADKKILKKLTPLFFEFIVILFRIYNGNDSNDNSIIKDYFSNLFCLSWTIFVIILVYLAV